MPVDDVLVAALIGYEVLAAASQRSRWVPSLPLLTTLLNGHSKLARWGFVASLAGLMVWHLELLA